MKQLKTNLIDQIFALLLVAKILGLSGATYSYSKLTFWYIAFFLLGLFVKWLLDPKTAEKIATKMYIDRNKRALKKAEKEAKKVVNDARQTEQ